MNAHNSSESREASPHTTTIAARKRTHLDDDWDGKCVRPRCDGVGRRTDRGLCFTHYAAFLKERGERGEVVRGFQDAKPVAEYIAQLSEAGIGSVRLAKLSGITVDTILRIKKQKRVLSDTARYIFAVPLPSSPHAQASDGRLIPSIGTQRRLQALQRHGYSLRWLSQQCTLTEDVLSRINRRAWITAKSARTVEELFRKYQLTFGGDVRAANRAARRGWAPPLAWDEDSLDDPEAEPFIGRRKYGDWLHSYYELREMGIEDDPLIAERLGIKLDTMQVRLRRLEESNNRVPL
ncbi:hypothetical protein JRC04_05370 [Mycolicibacterium sp. S2-37]|uniref:hypothetical protein n=1 Tax=Mycolicibacterium sp. S2-37 TaxID=2810297 RepID=UPI001A953217|nr:hypothetical protein [Mycolicibacterium sp. S2-37]MBO0676885.1 hypothetical protein [Mycolicibacterium sp. S2-37]